jgi:hypothetical protein
LRLVRALEFKLDSDRLEPDNGDVVRVCTGNDCGQRAPVTAKSASGVGHRTVPLPDRDDSRPLVPADGVQRCPALLAPAVQGGWAAVLPGATRDLLIVRPLGRLRASRGRRPLYCGANRTIYLDIGFFDLLARRAGLGGFAQAYVIGHEFGHHIQHLLGIDRRVAAANQANPAGQNALSVRVELQADCLAGVWAHSVYTRGELTTSDLEEKLNTAVFIGDDFQARAAGMTIDPGLFTHGSSAQRRQWLRTGFESGEPGACDTFSRG